jgi:streptomycin 6-kinase
VDLSSPVLEATRARLVSRFGPGVAEWWSRLPEAIDVLAARWDLVVGEPMGRGNTSLVIRCRRGGGPAAVLKLCPDSSLSRVEARALRAWQSSGRVPALWEVDAAAGAVLLEALSDERPVSERGRPVAAVEVAGLLRDLHAHWSLDAREFASLSARIDFIFDHWIERHRRDPAVTRVVPSERLARGRELALALAADSGAPVLLHGDLHPGNVLVGGAGRGLVAIDPRPCLGDPAFDAVDWVFWGEDDPEAWHARRAEIARAIGCGPDRLQLWCAALAPLLAASWAARGAEAGRIAALLALAR